MNLTHKNTPWHWDKPQQDTFQKLKDLMCKWPVLRQPNFDKPFFLHTDASAYGMGAILSQEGEINPLKPQKPKLHPVLSQLSWVARQ